MSKTMTIDALQKIVEKYYNPEIDPNINAEEVVRFALEWYNTFITYTDSTQIDIIQGTKSYSLSDSVLNVSSLLDDDYTVFKQYAMGDNGAAGDFFILPISGAKKLIFRSSPTRSRAITMFYQRRHNIPTSKTDVLTIPNNHRSVILAFAEAWITTHDSKEVSARDIPEEETYFLGQLSNHQQRLWQHCFTLKRQCITANNEDDAPIFTVYSWNNMKTRDYGYRQNMQYFN